MPTPVRRKRTSHPGAVALVTLLILIALAVFVLGNNVFIIREISVEGNRYCTKEEIIQSAGVKIGDGMFSIDTARVRDGINQNRYLKFVSLWRDFPSHLILRVEEQTPRATLSWMGTMALLGEGGVVLEQTADIGLMPPGVTITGMQVENIRAGQKVKYSVAGQGDAIDAVLAELQRQNMLSDISELNVATLDNLYLVTQDGLQVALGNDENLAKKVELARAALAYLRGTTETIRGGMLDVTSAAAADFRPEAKPTPTLTPSPSPDPTPSPT